MKNRKFHLGFVMCAILLFFSCAYPEAQLKKDSSASGEQGLKIIYPSAKMFTIQTAENKGAYAVFFSLNDYIQVSWIPYGPIIDDRWFYYMGIVDGQCNPVVKRFLLFDEQKKVECNYSGQTQAVFPTYDGFIVVYLIGNDFVYTEFDVNGKVLDHRMKFFRSENETIEKNRVLSIHYYQETIYLFILQPPVNIYRDRWHIDLVKRNIKNNKTRVMNNILPKQDGWYYVKNMETFFAGDTVNLACVDGQKSDSLSDQGMYRLSSVVYFARGAVTDTVFETRAVMTTDHYNECETRIIQSGRDLILIIKDNEMMWIQKIDEQGQFLGEAKQIEHQDKSKYVFAFSPVNDFPCPIQFSAE